MKKNLVVLTGPTAVGKTELSIELAGKLNAEIISADSIQVYKYMDVGSAKITKEEMRGVKHYLIDELEPDEEFNIFRFKEMALKYMDEIYDKGKIPLIVGGTGFYIQSILYDIQFSTGDDDKHIYRHELEEQAKIHGNEFVHDMLKKVDSESAEKIHKNNLKRVIRALEYYNETGKKFSEHNEEQRSNSSPYNFRYFVLNDDRERLYERINRRVDIMIDGGLEEEVRMLLKKGYTADLVSMQGIGYKEMVSYIRGEISLNEAAELIKKNTRNFAKRQLTWFRREKEVDFIDYRDSDYDKNIMLTKMLELCRSRNII